MKILSVLPLLFGLCNMLFAQSQLEVVVKGIKNTKGNIRVGIFKDEKSFLKEARFGKVVKAQKDEIKVVFELPTGKYAVSVIHDENENDELDSGLFGIPKEGFGFANDAMGTLGPPSFEKASIIITPQKLVVTITMRYL